MITAQTSVPDPAHAAPTPERAALAGAIDAQAARMDRLSAAIVRATSQVAWSGRAAERFRVRAAERARECLQLALALRASAERVHAAATAPARPAGHMGRPAAEQDPRNPESGLEHTLERSLDPGAGPGLAAGPASTPAPGGEPVGAAAGPLPGGPGPAR